MSGWRLRSNLMMDYEKGTSLIIAPNISDVPLNRPEKQRRGRPRICRNATKVLTWLIVCALSVALLPSVAIGGMLRIGFATASLAACCLLIPCPRSGS